MKKKPAIPENVLDFFRKTGAKGGKARAENHSKKQLSEWAKLGGRPKGSGKGEATKKTADKKGGK